MQLNSGDLTRRLEKLKESLVGAECIFQDRPVIAHVRLTAIEADARIVSVYLEFLPSAGFVSLPMKQSKVSSDWEGLSESPRHVSGNPYVGWSLHADPGLVRQLVSFAASFGEPITIAAVSDEKAALDRYHHLAKFIRERRKLAVV